MAFEKSLPPVVTVYPVAVDRSALSPFIHTKLESSERSVSEILVRRHSSVTAVLARTSLLLPLAPKST